MILRMEKFYRGDEGKKVREEEIQEREKEIKIKTLLDCMMEKNISYAIMM